MKVCFSLNNSMHINFFNTLKEVKDGFERFQEEFKPTGKVSIDLITDGGDFLNLKSIIIKH